MPKAEDTNGDFESGIKAGDLAALVDNVDRNNFENLGECVAKLHNDKSRDFLSDLSEINWEELQPRMVSRWLNLFEETLPKLKSKPNIVCKTRSNIGPQKRLRDAVVAE